MTEQDEPLINALIALNRVRTRLDAKNSNLMRSYDARLKSRCHDGEWRLDLG
jgi:hypothetical protein